MTRILLIPVLLSSAAVTVAKEPDATIATLKARVAELESENRILRNRLGEIAAISAATIVKPQPKLAFSLGSDNWGDAAKQDVLKVVTSAAGPLWESAGNPALHPITVLNNPAGPLVAYKRGPGDEYKVLVNVNGRVWAQLSYQFSHEMAHILANYRDVPNRQRWFEESICECASLYSLRRMGQVWKTKPPYSNWKSYAGSLTDYADKRIQDTAPVPENDLAAWYAANRATLAGKATDRKLNLVVAVRLLPIFEKHQNSWGAIRSLNRGNIAENETLDRYLEGWYSRVAESERPVVQDIAELFSLTLPE